MNDDAKQDPTDDEMRASQHVSDVVPRHLQKRKPSTAPVVRPKLTPEQQIEEQRQVESFLRASADAGVTKEVLTDRLNRIVEELSEDQTDSE